MLSCYSRARGPTTPPAARRTQASTRLSSVSTPPVEAALVGRDDGAGAVGRGARRAAHRPRAPAAGKPGALRRRAGVAASVAPGGAPATAEAKGRAGGGRGAADEVRHRNLEVDALERAVVAGVRRQRPGLPDMRQGHGPARRGPAAGDAERAGVAGEVGARAAVTRAERGNGLKRGQGARRDRRGASGAAAVLGNRGFRGVARGAAGCRGRIAGLARRPAAHRCGRPRLGHGLEVLEIPYRAPGQVWRGGRRCRIEMGADRPPSCGAAQTR